MKQHNKQLGFFSLVAISAASAVTGVFSTIGLATEQTGRSAWIAYGLAVLIGGVLRGLPVIIFTSMFRYKGGNYAMTTLTLGSLAGGIYALWWLPMFLSRGTTASALGQYINSVFPQISPVVASVIFTTVVFVVNLFGVNAMTKLQRPLMAIATGAMLVFILFGMTKLQPGSFALGNPEYYSNGRIGLLLAITLVIQPTSAPILLCGFSWEAKNPKRNVPLAILASSGIVFLIFVGMSFVAANTLPEEEMAGKTLTYAAQYILPGILFPMFLFLGPVLALCSGLNSSMASIAAPVLGAIQNGWIPESVGKTNKHGSPWIIYTAMWLICVVPLALGVSLKTFTAYTVMTQRICGLLILLVAFFLPKKFPQQWKMSFLHMPKAVYYSLLVLSGLTEIATLAASIIATSAQVFIGNVILAGVLALYAYSRYKSGKTHINISVDSGDGEVLIEPHNSFK